MSFQYESILKHPRLFTVDTDIGCDCDDAGCLAILFHNMKKSRLPLGAIVNCTANVWGCGAIDAIAMYYGFANIPMGQSGFSDILAEDIYHRYDRILAEEYSEAYRKGLLHPDDAIETYITLLQQAPAKGMVLVSVGPLHLLAELWNRASKLIEEKVYALVCMGGVYGDFEHNGHKEYNFYICAEATKTVFEQYPCPIICIGLELGKAIQSGFQAADDSNPVNRAYNIHTKGRFRRPSWDPLTVLFALEGEGDRFELSRAGRNEIAQDGSNYFHFDANGNHFYLKAKKPYWEIADELNILLAKYQKGEQQYEVEKNNGIVIDPSHVALGGL